MCFGKSLFLLLHLKLLSVYSKHTALVSLSVAIVSAAGAEENAVTNSSPAWATNGPAVFKIEIRDQRPEVREEKKAEGLVQRSEVRRPVFDHYVPESLNNLVWTNVLARTNARITTVWSVRTHPPGWPSKPTIVEWNTNCVMWGMRGVTAICPCWEDEGSIGQGPITALTKRHGYTRGHGMGPDGFTKARNGKKIWFVTTNNVIVEMTVKGAVVRSFAGGGKADYTIVLFSKDLPDSIEPMRVVDFRDFNAKYPNRPPSPWPLFQTEQSGNVSIGLPGFSVNTWKGGDSGSPNMLPFRNELVFVNGRSTSSASPEMQKDMNILCRAEGLNPDKYQLQWVDISAFPGY